MKEFPITPMLDRIFVKKDSMKTDPKTGFALPDTVKGRAQIGTVIAAGPGYLDVNTGKFYPLDLKVGDKVFISEFSGSIIRYKDLDEFFILSYQDILGKIKSEE